MFVGRMPVRMRSALSQGLSNRRSSQGKRPPRQAEGDMKMPRRIPSNAVTRVMIRCPVTGDEVPTGFSTISSDMFDRTLPGVLEVWCESCAQYHLWSNKDAFLR